MHFQNRAEVPAMVNRALRNLAEATTEVAKHAAHKAHEHMADHVHKAESFEIENQFLDEENFIDLLPKESGSKATEIFIVIGAALAIAACGVSYFFFKCNKKCHQSYTDGK